MGAASSTSRRNDRVGPFLGASGHVSVAPATSRSVAEQALLIARITQELRASGTEPAAVIVNESSTAILLPAGAAQPIALPVHFTSDGTMVSDRSAIAANSFPTTGALATQQALKHAPPHQPTEEVPASESPPLALPAKPSAGQAVAAFEYELFVSHCKRTEASEDRAIWVSDIAEAEGLKVFFDRSDLTEISSAKLESCVRDSRVIVTILDPYTFDSEWVTWENEWARDAGRPVVGLYDGDRFRWEQIAKWRESFPHVFLRPVINYQKDYRVESKKRLLAAIKEAALAAPTRQPPAAVASNAHGPSPGKSPAARRPNAMAVRIAVGKSTATDGAAAVRAAWRHLRSKLGGDVTPHFVICAYTGKHSPAPLGRALAEVCPRGCSVIGLSAGFGGLIYEDQWLATAAETSGAAIALWGIYDPAGAYEVVHDPSGLPSRVRAAVAKGVEPHVQRGMPRLTLSYATPSFERPSLQGIHEVVGESAVVFGLGVGGPEGMAPTETNLPCVFAVRGGEAFDEARMGCGVAAALCWPSCHIAGAFSQGGTRAVSDPPPYKVSKVGAVPNISLTQQAPGYAKEADAGREVPTDCVIEEIDGRPAMEVYREMLPSDEARARFDELAQGKTTFDEAQSMAFLEFTAMPLAVKTGVDERGEAVYKLLCVLSVINRGLVLFAGLRVEEGDVIEVLTANGEDARKRTAETVTKVIEDAGFDFDHVQGALTVGCGLYYFLGGFDEGAKDLAERLGSAVNWAPTLGVLGGPELGPMGEARSDYAVYTVGCVVFSSRAAKAQTLMLTDGSDAAGDAAGATAAKKAPLKKKSTSSLFSS